MKEIKDNAFVVIDNQVAMTEEAVADLLNIDVEKLRAVSDHGVKVQRDMYSAFLIMNVNEDLKSFNIEKCNERFEKFYELHEEEVARLKGNKNLSSIAI